MVPLVLVSTALIPCDQGGWLYAFRAFFIVERVNLAYISVSKIVLQISFIELVCGLSKSSREAFTSNFLQNTASELSSAFLRDRPH